jgi:hypothetical protein
LKSKINQRNTEFMSGFATSSVQAAEVDYDLHTLGWKAFQQLCVTVASEIWGQTVQGYFEGNDGGRDAVENDPKADSVPVRNTCVARRVGSWPVTLCAAIFA